MMRTSLILIAALAACGDVAPIDHDAALPADACVSQAGCSSDVADAAIAADARLFGAWSLPQIIPNINTDSHDTQPSVSPDGRHLYFRRYVTLPGVQPGAIYYSTRLSAADSWSAPAAIPDTGYQYTPEISRDGLELYTTTFDGLRRWTRTSTTAAWVTFTDLWQVFSPALTGDGLTLYYITSPGGVAMRKRSALLDAWGPEQLVAIPGDLEYRSVSVSPDDLYMVLDSPVLSVSRNSVGEAWGDVAEIPTLADADATACDLVSQTEMYCEIDLGDNKEIILVTRN